MKTERGVRYILHDVEHIFHCRLETERMSFREKSAWIALVSVLLCFGVYFGAIAIHRISGRGLDSLQLLSRCVGAFVVLQIGLKLAALWATPRDGRSPRDERERLIQARSHTIGYYLLLGLVMALGIPFHIGRPAADLVNFALLDVVIAGLVVAAAQIVMFRRGV